MEELELTWLQYLGIMRFTEQLQSKIFNLVFISSKDVDLYLKCINEGLSPNDEVHYQDGCLLWQK